MPGINLAQGAKQEAAQKKEGQSKRGMWIVALVLVLVFAAWGALEWYENLLSGEIRDMDRQIDETRGEISVADLSRVADFHFRLESIGENMDTGSYPHLMLGAMESDIDADVVLSAFQFEESSGEIVLEGVAGEFQAMVRQLVAFKSSPDISSVALQSLQRNESGRFDFILSVRMTD